MPNSTRPGALDVSKLFKLIIEDDEGKTIVFPLTEGETTIGRSEGNTIRLMERNVSRRHARIICTAEQVFIEDLDSYIGVHLNGDRLEFRRSITEGDLLEIGDYHIALRLADTEDEEIAAQVVQALPTDSLTVSEGPMHIPPDPVVPPVEAYRLPEELFSGANLEPESTPTEQAVPDSARGPGADTIPERRRSDPETLPVSSVVSNLPPFPQSSSVIAGAISDAKPVVSSNAFLREPGDAGLAAAEGPQLTADVPRLICVNTQHAGLTYNIEGEELTLGRVDDNDIVIEHPSVSRNHAKLLTNGEEFHVHDLKSANGILVNGSEHTKTRLQPNDLIELGSVRFRFIPAGVPFHPTEEETREIRANGIEPPTVDRSVTTRPDRLSSRAGNATLLLGKKASSPSSRRRKGVSVSSSEESRTQYVRRRPESVVPGNAPSSLSTANRGEGDAPYPSPAASWPVGGALLGLLVGLLLGGAALLTSLILINDESAHDRKLEQMFSDGKYSDVKVYFEAHEGEFRYPLEAATVFGRALRRLEAPKFDGSAADAPVLEVHGEARSQQALTLFRQGQEALNSRRLREAEDLLTKCAQIAPNFAMCHLSLGMLYAANNPQRALGHYKKFLQLAPDADDADHVREMIRTVEGELEQ